MHPQLAAFVEVVRRGSVTGAARALFVTQPALTARLNALERTVGTPLLVRRRGGVRMTEAGRAFLPYAERALQAVAEGRTAVSELEHGAAGNVAICASPIVSTYALPTILKRFAETRPGVQVAVRTGHSEEMIELVKRDEVAVGLLRSFNDAAVEQFTLYEDELVLVVHAAHPSGDVVRLADLAEEQFVLFDRASSYHELTNAMFLEAGIAPRSVMELDNVDSAKKMVALGLGIAFLPHVAVADEMRSGTLRIVEL
ncbi:MAG: LysR family transcriptional regulator, partial [Anaeromyxobacteraceae bacterium]